MKQRSRFAAFRARLGDRLARSSRIFFLGLLVACGVEVVVDWNQALYEINVLRDQVRQKGANYAGLLARVVVDPMQRGHMGTLDRLSLAILEDEDAIYVRITDADGKQVYDRLDRLYEKMNDKANDKAGRGTFRKHYAYFLDRDMRGMTSDPEGFKQRLANSRYRDLPQIWADGMARALAVVFPAEPKKPGSREVIYQDRLRDENRRRDDSVSWAVAPLEKDGKRVGAVLIAFDLTRTNRAASNKYLKGLGMVIFFVGLILAQSIASRRDKLRLLDIESRHRGTKEALRAALPQSAVEHGAIHIQGVLEQAHGTVDGMVWDVRADADAAADTDEALSLLIVDPDGDGIDAAAVGLHTLRTFRNGTPSPAELFDEVVALGEVIANIPLARPIAILLLRVRKNGDFTGLSSDFADLQILGGNGATAKVAPVILEPRAKDDGSAEESPGIVGPLFSCRGTLPAGETLVIACAGKGEKVTFVGGEPWNRRLLRSRTQPAASGQLPLEDLALFLRGKQPDLAQNDIVVVAVRRT